MTTVFRPTAPTAPTGPLREPATNASSTSATAREIAQQPALWREAMADHATRQEAIRIFLQAPLEMGDLRIVLTGAGTSAFAGQLLAPALARKLGRRVDAVATTDIVSNPREAFAQDVPTLLVSFARSGDSPESVAATALADRCLTSVHHLVVTCNPDGELAREHSTAEHSLVLLMPKASNDKGFAMTSSFTCMVLTTWFALASSAQDADILGRVADAGEQMLRDHAQAVGDLVARGYQRVVYLGSGSLSGLARESALKMLELTAGAVVSYFDSALGFRHGPKSVLDGKTLTVVYLSNDSYTRQYDEDIAAELQQALGLENVVVIAARPPRRLTTGQVWTVSGLEDAPDALVSLPFVLVAQMLALQTSVALGLTPDDPFPSGEVNRVVRGVSVHPLDEGE